MLVEEHLMSVWVFVIDGSSWGFPFLVLILHRCIYILTMFNERHCDHRTRRGVLDPMDGAPEALVDLKVFKTNLKTNGAAEGTPSSLDTTLIRRVLIAGTDHSSAALVKLEVLDLVLRHVRRRTFGMKPKSTSLGSAYTSRKSTLI